MAASRQVKISFFLLIFLAFVLLTLNVYRPNGSVKPNIMGTLRTLENRIEELHVLYAAKDKDAGELVEQKMVSNSVGSSIFRGSGGYGSCARLSQNSSRLFRKDTYKYFTDKFVLDKEPIASWTSAAKIRQFCKGKMAVYDNRFGLVHNVYLNPTLRPGYQNQAKGGEEIRHVMNQQVNKEEYNFENGFWEINCPPGSSRPEGKDNMKWLKYLKINEKETDDNETVPDIEVVNKYVVAVARGDYANLHNWARNIYNTFLLMSYFNIQPKDISVMFLDGHPRTALDLTWETLYGPPIRVGHMSKPVLYKNFLWGLLETDGPVSNFRSKSISYTEEFRAFVLNHHNLDDIATLDCKRLRITVVIRRNAVYHPRNIAGNVGRKIFNEAELIDSLMKTFPGACVQGVLMEALPMQSQLEVISQTDVLIGMHGAGMSHTLFLPQHAAILELFAKDFKRGRPWFECFQAIARWRSLKYDSWENMDSKSDLPHDFTLLPVDVITEKAKGLVKQIC